MGPNTVAALHLGADHMLEQLALREANGGGAEAGAAVAAAADAEEAPPSGEVGLAAVSGAAVHEEDEAAVLRAIREARRAELKAARAAARFGAGVQLIDKVDWQREVVDGSCANGGTWVVVHLAHAPNPRCAAAAEALDALSRRAPQVSFVSIKAEHCMPASQYHLLPSVFCYRDGKLAERLISQELCAAGANPTADEIEWKLAQLGVLETDLPDEPKSFWSVAEPDGSGGGDRSRVRRVGKGDGRDERAAEAEGSDGGGGDDDDEDDDVEDGDDARGEDTTGTLDVD